MDKVLQLTDNADLASTPRPRKAKRLETKLEHKDKPGPILLEFADEESKWAFLKTANAKLRTKNIYCKLDESKAVR